MKRGGTTPHVLAAALLLTGLAAGLGTLPAGAEEETVTAVPLHRFRDTEMGARIQGLVWHGGLELQSAADTFGGLSGLGFTDDQGRLVMVTDRGNFVSGQLIYDDAGRPLSLVGVRIEPIRNSKGAELPRAFARDAEAVAVIERGGRAAAVRVGFENLTRVADFQLVDGMPTGAAKEVSIPDWLTDTRTNKSLEAVCIAPPASPISGSTLLLTEGVIDDDGLHSAWLLGQNDRGPLNYLSSPGTDPTDCAFLPNGDLLVLERGVALVTFSIRLKRIPAADVRPDAHMEGEVLLEAAGAEVDNLEAVAVHAAPDGTTRITLVSDNNFNDWQRNLLLEFSLAE